MALSVKLKKFRIAVKCKGEKLAKIEFRGKLRILFN